MSDSTRNWKERIDDSEVIQSTRMQGGEQGSIKMLHTSKAASFPESSLKGKKERTLGTSVSQNKTKIILKFSRQFQLKFASCLNYTEKNSCFASALIYSLFSNVRKRAGYKSKVAFFFAFCCRILLTIALDMDELIHFSKKLVDHWSPSPSSKVKIERFPWKNFPFRITCRRLLLKAPQLNVYWT